MSTLEKKIGECAARVSVIGMGYVGLPLARRAREVGYDVSGVDKYMGDNERDSISEEGIPVHKDYGPVRESDVVLICVPTPLAGGQEPDLRYVREAASEVADNFGAGDCPKLVVLESTSYPGTTREVLLPIFRERGLRLGERLNLAYAPERVDPGSGKSEYGEIPRVVGAMDDRSGRLAYGFYDKLVSSVFLAPSPEVAEMSKLLENIFRAVNIALVNEMSLLCRRMGIGVWDVIEAASTKPFGFMQFNPGPGLGGHCIPVDPFYLAWRAREYDFYPEFIELAGKVNRSMPFHVVRWVSDALNGVGKSVRGARTLVIGVSYKEDVADTRESPALKAIELLDGMGAEVIYHDSRVGSVEVGGKRYESAELNEDLLEGCDCVLILTAHSDLDRSIIASSGLPVVDTRNALGRGGG